MAKIHIVLLFVLYQFCFCSPKGDTYLFHDCMEKDSTYCFSFEHEFPYKRNDNLIISWGTYRSYAFVSELDTIEISLFRHKIDEHTLQDYSIDSLQNGRLVPGFCNKKKGKNVNSFFKGSFVLCDQENKRRIVFIGYTILGKSLNGFSIVVTSNGVNISDKQKDNFEEIIKTMKISNVLEK